MKLFWSPRIVAEILAEEAAWRRVWAQMDAGAESVKGQWAPICARRSVQKLQFLNKTASPEITVEFLFRTYVRNGWAMTPEFLEPMRIGRAGRSPRPLRGASLGSGPPAPAMGCSPDGYMEIWQLIGER